MCVEQGLILHYVYFNHHCGYDHLFSLSAFYVEVTELQSMDALRPPPIHYPMKIPRTRKTLSLKYSKFI